MPVGSDSSSSFVLTCRARFIRSGSRTGPSLGSFSKNSDWCPPTDGWVCDRTRTSKPTFLIAVCLISLIFFHPVVGFRGCPYFLITLCCKPVRCWISDMESKLNSSTDPVFWEGLKVKVKAAGRTALRNVTSAGFPFIWSACFRLAKASPVSGVTWAVIQPTYMWGRRFYIYGHQKKKNYSSSGVKTQ